MIEVKRYRFKGAAGEYVYVGDYDNSVRCFLDAAERCVAAERREADVRKELERTKRCMEINGDSAQGKHLEGLRYRDERDALQLLLNAVDQRKDDLESLLEQVLTNANRALPSELKRSIRNLLPAQEAPAPANEEEREPFEAWHRRRFATKHSTGQPTRDMHNGIRDPNYGPPDQQHMWEAWQARAALKPADSERDQGIPGTSFQRLNMLANQGE